MQSCDGAGEKAAAVQQDGPLVHGYLIFGNYRCTLDGKKIRETTKTVVQAEEKLEEMMPFWKIFTKAINFPKILVAEAL